MPMTAPVAMGIMAASSAASAGAGIAGAAMSGGGSAGGRLKLTPEQEIAYLNRTQKNLAQIDADIQRTRTIESTLKKRLTAAENIVKSTMPSNEDLKALRDTGVELAKSFGGDAAAAVKAGFLDEASRQELEASKAVESGDFGNEQMKQLINSQKDERTRLQSSLVAAGASPSQVNDRLARFDREAAGQLETMREELRNSFVARSASRISSNLAARESGYNIAAGEYGLLGGTLQYAQGGAQTLANLATQGYQAGMAGVEARAGLRGEATGQYTTMGQFDFSGEAKNAMESGLVGPGTMYEQTGISRNEQGHYKDIVRTAENSIVDPGLHGWQDTYQRENPEGWWKDPVTGPIGLQAAYDLPNRRAATRVSYLYS